jgi:hypothetical protein
MARDVCADRYHEGVEPGHVREFDSSRKDHHWGRRKLARDQSPGLQDRIFCDRKSASINMRPPEFPIIPGEAHYRAARKIAPGPGEGLSGSMTPPEQRPSLKDRSVMLLRQLTSDQKIPLSYT